RGMGRSRRGLGSAAAVIVVGLCVVCAAAARSGQAYADQHGTDPADGSVDSGTRAVSTQPLVPPLAIAWSFQLVHSGSSPAVADGIVYVGSSDSTNPRSLFALNLATGSLQWNYSVNFTFLSSPAVANGIVYAAPVQD